MIGRRKAKTNPALRELSIPELSRRTLRLQWFVDFANLDLEHIGPGDKAKLLVEAEGHLWPKEELREYQSAMPRGYPLPPSITKKLRWMVEVPSRESAQYWAGIRRSQKVVRRTFVQHVLPTGHPSRENLEAKEKPAVVFVVRRHDEVLWSVVKGDKLPYAVKLLPVAESQVAYLPLRIFMLLDGLPQHAVSLCPGCQRFFFNPTNREKRFCSERCMRRVVTREYRETHKKAYDRGQAKLMQSRYRKGCDQERTASGRDRKG
jgi:hypothetical protein